MNGNECVLGDDVKDTITGYVGCVVAKTEWLNGCWRISVQSRELKDGKPIDAVTFDVEQLVLVKSSRQAEPVRRTGGDRPDAPGRPTVGARA